MKPNPTRPTPRYIPPRYPKYRYPGMEVDSIVGFGLAFAAGALLVLLFAGGLL